MANFKKLTHTITRKVEFEYNNGVYRYEYYYEFDDCQIYSFDQIIFTNLDTNEEIHNGSQLYIELKSLASKLKF